MSDKLGAGDLRQHIDAHRELLIARIRGALEEHAFSNRALFPPRRLREIAQEEAESFLEFLHGGDEEAARQRGRNLAREGLGQRSILAMAEALRQAGWESVNPEMEACSALQKVLGRYSIALLEGYMAGREESVLEQQERTRQALLRALQRQNG